MTFGFLFVSPLVSSRGIVAMLQANFTVTFFLSLLSSRMCVPMHVFLQITPISLQFTKTNFGGIFTLVCHQYTIWGKQTSSLLPRKCQTTLNGIIVTAITLSSTIFNSLFLSLNEIAVGRKSTVPLKSKKFRSTVSYLYINLYMPSNIQSKKLYI